MSMDQRRASGGFVLALAVGFIGLGNAHCGGGNSASPPSDLAYSVNPAVYTIGTPITANVPTSSGGAVVSYAVAPALPAGLSLSTTTGIISGTPTAVAAIATYTVTATNGAGSTSASLSVTVTNVAPSHLTYSANPATYTVGTSITANTPTSTGGAVVSYAVAPALPAGLSLDITTGVISGTPTAITAMASYVVTATNALGNTTASVSITVNDALPSITYSDNPAAYTIDVPIAANTPTDSGGAVISYAVAPALPAGLSLDTTTGIISGTPTAITAAASYVVTATNSGGSATVSVSIAVNAVAPRALTYSANPAVYTVGTLIAVNTPTISGGTVISYAVAPALPAGLSFNTSTGVISGTPTLAAVLTIYTVTATNSGGSTTDNVTITVKDIPPTALTYSTNPATYTKGTAIANNVPSHGGGVVVSYSVTPALPASLSLNTSTGVISGTPTVVAGTASYTVTATNSGGSITASVSITVKDVAPSALTYSANPVTYTKGAAITPNTPSNSGGTIVTYSVTPALPAGLALSPTTGIITGTPTVLVAVATYTVTGTNSGGTTTVGISITVNDLPPTALVYSANPATYTKGTAITPNTPSNSGGAIISYSVTPTLPAGLALSPTTGIISGTPTAITATSNFTVTGTNGVGNTMVVISITVHDAAPTALTYSTNPATYTKGVAIASNVPMSSGGAVVSYSVAPALPAGLALSTTTGVITGTPTVLTPAANFVVTATNLGGSATVTLSITVNDVAPTGLTYLVNPATYTKNSPIASNTPTSGGGPVISYAVTPTLPAGLALNTSTGAITGTPTVVTATTAFTVTATNTGGFTTVSLSITVKDIAPTALAYSVNPATYFKGVAITPNTPSNTGGTIISYSVSPALPAGLALSTTTGIISGTPTALMAAANFTVTGTNTGGFATVSVSITINDVAPTGLTYSANPVTYIKGTLITPNNPSNTGGTPVSYAVSPALPAGLALSSTTGIITGTPTVVASAANYIVTATNTAGSTNASVNITVNDAPPTALSYSANPASFTKGTLITPDTPSNTGGTVVSYAVSPTLPAGLALSTTTGIITGTPTVLAPAANFIVTATNTGGSTTVSLSITVKDVAPSGLTYSSNPAVYTVGAAIPQNVPSSSGGAVVSYAVAPALPAGLALSTTTGIISGTPTAVTAAANFTVTATNSGGNATASVNITVNVASPTRYALVANESDNTVSLYTVDTTTGLLRTNGYVVTGASTQPRTVAVHPTGKYAYVANINANTVSAYSIGTSSGQLTAIGSPVLPGNRPFAVTVDPKGRYAYVVNFDDDTIVAFTVGSGGALTVVGTALATGTGPDAVTVDPTGRFVYVANQTAGGVSAYAIQSNGALLSLGSATAGTTPASVTVDPTGRFAYVANAGGGGVSLYSIGSTGALTVTGSATAGTNPSGVAVSPSGAFAYVANAGSNNISVFSISPTTGALTAAGTPATSPNPVSITVDSSGDFAYASNFNTNNVTTYSVSPSTGALTLVQTIGARQGATSFALAQGAAPVAYVPKFAYVANAGGNTVSAYTIAAGALTHIGVDVSTGQGPASVAVDPTGSFAYVANQSDGTVSAYTIGSGGALTQVGSAISAGTPSSGTISVTVDPSARFVYAANNASGDVATFAITPATGGLVTDGGNVTSGSAPFCIAVDPTGRFAYVVNQSGASVAAFNIDPTTGALSIIGTSNAATGNSPVSVAVDPSGNFVYVTNEDDNTVSAFLINTGSGSSMGAVSPIGSGTVDAGTAPHAVAVDPTGKFVYVANDGSNDVWTYTIGSSGALTAVGTGILTGTATAPRSVAVDTSGTFVYAANSATASDSVTVFSINTGAGAPLIEVGSPVPAGGNPNWVTISGIIQ
jgi:6-phosphogluconolactonase (cycloisomerase 2 family)